VYERSIFAACEDFVEADGVLVERDGRVGLLFELKAVTLPDPLLAAVAVVELGLGVALAGTTAGVVFNSSASSFI
jgi:hypothetical protein